VVRYRGVPVPCLVSPARDGTEGADVRFTAETADLPIASPGQAIVFYLHDEVLGGGTIRTVTREAVPRGDELEVAG
jgi:tRNA U34 2-thiouridine synthase MnmA/TrmU